MKAYKIEILVIDFDGIGEDEIKSVIENAKYPNRCINPAVMDTKERDIGDWSDDHPLNKYETMAQAYQDIFTGAIK